MKRSKYEPFNQTKVYTTMILYTYLTIWCQNYSAACIMYILVYYVTVPSTYTSCEVLQESWLTSEHWCEQIVFIDKQTDKNRCFFAEVQYIFVLFGQTLQLAIFNAREPARARSRYWKIWQSHGAAFSLPHIIFVFLKRTKVKEFFWYVCKKFVLWKKVNYYSNDNDKY